MPEQETTSVEGEMSTADTTEMVTPTTETGEMSGTDATEEKAQSQPSIDDLRKELDATRAALKKANSESTKERLTVKELTPRLKELTEFKERVEAEKLTVSQQQELAKQKLEQELAELKQQFESTVQQANKQKIETAISSQANKLGFADPDDALLFISRHEDEIEKDENGSPTNIKEMLTDLLKSKPYLKSQSKPTSGGATNPPRSQTLADNTPITWAYIEKAQADPEAYAALPAERKKQIVDYMNDRRNARGRR